MAVNRRIRKGLATKALCFLNHEGKAPVEYLARYFGQSGSSMQRVLDKLEDRQLIAMATADRGNYFVTGRGHSASTHTKCRPLLEAFKNRRR